jgi:aspartate/methionine/tyrosine aminotransferase
MAGREYGPTAGIKGLRAAVANLYNVHHREGKKSLYSWENVCIVPGGRAGLIRIAAVLNNAYLGFFIPDYTAYNEMLSLFKNVSLCFLGVWEIDWMVWVVVEMMEDSVESLRAL